MDGERTGADEGRGSRLTNWVNRPARHAFALFRRPPWRRPSQANAAHIQTGEAPATGRAPWRRGETSKKTRSRGAIVKYAAIAIVATAFLAFTPIVALELTAR